MKIHPSGIISDMNGKLGGSSIQRNRSGLYLKNWQRPKKTISQQSFQSKNIFSELQKLWSLLSDAQRTSWINLSKEIRKNNAVSMPMHLSGINLFLSCNRNLHYLTFPYIYDPEPTLFFPIADAFTIIDFPMSKRFRLYINLNPASQGCTFICYLSFPCSPGVSAVPSQLLYCGAILPFPQSLNIFYSAYKNLTKHEFISNKKYFFKLIPVNGISGVATSPLFLTYNKP